MPAPRTDRPPRRIAFLIAGFGMFGPFSIDAIFPGFPAIAKELAASPVMMQQIISVYLAGFGLMSLFHGPLSDALGRRKIVLWSTVVFVLASAGAALSSSLEILLAWRLIQGCSAGGGVIVGRAIIRDLAAGPVAQKMIAQVMMIFALSPAIAPIAGAFLCSFGGWRAVFWAVGLFACLLLLVAGLILPESLPFDHRHRLHFGSLLRTYRRISMDHQFMLLSMSNALNFAALFLYVSSAPRFIFDFLHLSSSEFYWLFVPAVTGIVIGSGVAMRTSGRLTDSIVLRVGFGIMMAAWMANNVMTAVLHYPGLPWAVLPIGVHAFGMALNQPLLTLLALDRFPKQRGAASSMQAFLSLGVNATVSGVISAAVSISPLTLSITAFALNAIGLILWLMTGGRKEGSAHQVIADEPIIAE
jgi:DHA1 family bicyclomycin/chloramphenicol resistance-like MFS transporter